MCTGASKPRPEQWGLRVVWDNPAFSPGERADIEDLLAHILAEGLVEACSVSSLEEAQCPPKPGL